MNCYSIKETGATDHVRLLSQPYLLFLTTSSKLTHRGSGGWGRRRRGVFGQILQKGVLEFRSRADDRPGRRCGRRRRRRDSNVLSSVVARDVTVRVTFRSVGVITRLGERARGGRKRRRGRAFALHDDDLG